MSDHRLAGPAERFIERMGLVWEGQGLPRIAGRILGYLTLQGEPATLDDIAAALGVSKASVCNDARRLERLTFVERTSRPADRRDYYVIAPDLPARVVARKLGELEQLDAVLGEARGLPETPLLARERLDAFGEFQARVMDHLRDLLASLECDGRRLPHHFLTAP